ncbi:phytase [Luteimonas sp. BDR2-5]|uniref:phytase n=1 Tax=Proluteimonas luteida TaxID=2878685 RepID=UPI001E4E6CAE|nr:phytase [Luteimonas sp. BDR2-5]MCD9027531.1 phytase [Luteimonas sp. BDR2-5]
MSKSLPFAAALLLAWLAGCTTTGQGAQSPPSVATPTGLPAVVERYLTPALDGAELDSLATWPTPDGATWLIASAKRSHELLVFDADTGHRLRTVGGKGEAPGAFNRPNGVFVHGDLLLVSERDNHRVQVLALPDFAPALLFGTPELRSPYGLWAHETAPDTLEVYVTDSFMEGPDFRRVPPFDQLDRRVRRYRLDGDAHEGLRVTALGSFGDTRERTALRIVESIAGDPASGRLLIADEDMRHEATLREYTFDGQPTGRALPGGTFLLEPEGIALWACTADSGYWIVADQVSPLTVFRLFDRQSLAPAGAFTGTTVDGTDGIALHPSPTRAFPGGALFAVHADRAIGAFDLRDIVATLQLDPACVQ